MLLHYEKPNVFTIQAGEGAFITIIPGTNKLSDAQWNVIKSHPGIQAKISSGFLKVVTDAVPDESSGGNELSAMNATDAISAVKGTYDEKLLGEWALSETRKSVLNAINAQLKLMYVPPKDTKEVSA